MYVFCLSLNKRRDVVVYSVFEYTNRIYIIFVLQIRNEVIILGRKPLRECGKAGCHELTRDYYCDKHKVNRHKVYDKEQRNKQADKFYHSEAWKKVRAKAMSKAHGLCQDCLARGVLTNADMVHHIKPLRDYPKLATDLNNLKPLCNKCHGQY